MYNLLLALHNLLRWIILLLLIANVIRHFAAMRKPFITLDKKLGLILMIFAHIQLLTGLFEWFAGAWGIKSFLNNGAAQVMQNNTERFFAVEHTTSMIVAIVLITVARGIYRKQIPDGKKHRRCIVLYTLALVIILAMIPWPGMDEIGRSLMPKF
jgi:hypothetical protein